MQQATPSPRARAHHGLDGALGLGHGLAARDDRRHRRVRQRELQRRRRQRHAALGAHRLELARPGHDLLARILVVELGARHRARREDPRVERPAHDDPDAVLDALGEDSYTASR